MEIKNKKINYLYELEESYTAGIQLFGTEIKSIRQGKAGLTDSYCFFLRNELWVRMHIAEYDFGSYNNHDPRRDRKLLLTRRELNKLERKTKIKGVTIIPVRLFINEDGFAKIEIAVARGKRKYDKRQSLKAQDSKRELSRLMKV